MVSNFEELVELINDGIAVENVSFGGGGYCVILRDEKNDGRVYAAYAWGLEEAFQKSEERLREERASDFKDEDTCPG